MRCDEKSILNKQLKTTQLAIMHTIKLNKQLKTGFRMDFSSRLTSQALE
jgi:hypothetical protein